MTSVKMIMINDNYRIQCHQRNFLYDHDRFNKVIEELIVAIDKLDYHYDHNPSKIKRSN